MLMVSFIFNLLDFFLFLDDEIIEVTPKSLRLRKFYLDGNMRKSRGRAKRE